MQYKIAHLTFDDKFYICKYIAKYNYRVEGAVHRMFDTKDRTVLAKNAIVLCRMMIPYFKIKFPNYDIEKYLDRAYCLFESRGNLRLHISECGFRCDMFKISEHCFDVCKEKEHNDYKYELAAGAADMVTAFCYGGFNTVGEILIRLIEVNDFLRWDLFRSLIKYYEIEDHFTDITKKDVCNSTK